MKKVCAYEGKQSADIPECEGEVVFAVKGYWQGEARKKNGPDMMLCEGHAKWGKEINPFGPVASAQRI